MRVMDVLREGEDTGAGTGGAGGGGSADVEFYKSEAKKAFDARDKAKGEWRKAQEEGLLLTPEQKAEIDALRTAAQQAEEERKKKAGEFDSLRVDLVKKHESALAERDAKVSEATTRLHTVLKDHAFAAANEWFGPEAKTILTPAIAAAYFGKYVTVEEHDGADRVVVKDLSGHVILDAKTGKPAAFTKAIGELIGMLDDKDSILRGSGKTGSGSSGGHGRTHETDLESLTARVNAGDVEAIKELRRRKNASGGLVLGAGVRKAS